MYIMNKYMNNKKGINKQISKYTIQNNNNNNETRDKSDGVR